MTFLFTDVEGSTSLLDELGADAYAVELMRHRRLLRDAFARHGGVEVDTQGDAFFVAFASAREAIAAAAEAQGELSRGLIRVRMGLHTGEALRTDQGYVGMDVHRAARIAAVGHGGQVLLSRTTHDLLRPDVPLRDLGDHRLKDLSAPERLYQLGDGAFPPLKSLYRTNLPIPSTPFLGRYKELAEVVALLSRRDVRLLTLTGAGGTGKTRLAAQGAAVASSAYPDGVWWVPLAAVRAHELVLETARQVLGARMELAEHIGDRSMLLLLDNFEHVVEAAGELASILSVCPDVNVLVTSREPLHIGGEHEYAVPTLLDHDAVTLFVARAMSVDRSFEATDIVAEICRRLDNLPLAVELAAARVKALTPRQILERLERRLPLLIGGARDVPERQRTLRATIQWSYELLTSDERRLFARLSAFFGGCTLDAAEQVAEADVDTLQSLVDKSLLRRRAGRYWMLETIREFAADELTAEGEHETTSTRHADYFVALVEQAQPAFDTSEEARWTERLVQDHDNFRAALAHLSGSPEQLRLACALSKFWQRQGSHSEGRRWLEAALGARAEAPPRDVARALRGVAVFARIQGDLDAAESTAAESASIARRTGDRRLELHAVGTLANIAIMRRDYERGMDLHLHVEALARELGDEHSVGVAMGNRAYLALEHGDFELALALAAETLALSREISDSANATVAALNLAIAAHALGRQQAARDALTEGIERARALGHRAFLIDGLIIAAAVVVPHDPRTATALLVAADRAVSELTIELAPVERDLHASVESQLPQRLADPASDEASRGDLDAVLEAAADRALRSLSS